MSGLEKIISEIHKKAEAEAMEIVKDAEKYCETYLAEEKKKIADEISEYEKKALQDRELYQSKAKSGADFQERNAVLKAKQKNINLALEQAYQKMISLPDVEYFSMLTSILKDNVLAKDGEILFGEKDLQRMTSEFQQDIEKVASEKGGTLKIVTEAAPIKDGFILRYGMIEENCTLKALFDTNQERLKDIASKELFG